MWRLFVLISLFCGVLTASAEEIRYTGGVFRDPFTGRVQEKPADDSFWAAQRIRAMKIQGVLLSAKDPRAIIGGKIYRIGSALESGKVSGIDKEGVTVTLDGKEVVIEHKMRKLTYEIPKST